MAPPKKTVKKMDLTSFLNDDTFGSSWAEEDVDLNKITIPIETANATLFHCPNWLMLKTTAITRVQAALVAVLEVDLD